MKSYVIHKPTHLFKNYNDQVIATGQKRGDSIVLNRFGGDTIIEKTWAVGACCDHLTGYGDGVAGVDGHIWQAMRSAWSYMFGDNVDAPLTVEKV